MTDTAEDFTPLAGADNAALDAMFIAPPKTFQGNKLFPYSEGVRLLLGSAAAGTPGTDHWLMILMFLLIDLQAGYEKARAEGKNEDDATDAATEAVLTAIGDNPRGFQAQVVRRAGKLGKKGVAEALKIAVNIYTEAQSTELVPAEESAAPGK